ncbi:motility accessory factor [Campylobacter insulaenigrae]|nr:motility accessory factor [Campylobacter insulaenigrae]
MQTIMVGSSYGGYLASLCAKIAPWNVDVVIDNSSHGTLDKLWYTIGFGKEIDFTKYFCFATNIFFENIIIYAFDKTYWTSNKQSPRYFSPARKLIREILNKDHLKTQSLYPKPKYISYNSNFDQYIPLQDKEQMYNYLKELGFDIEFTNNYESK